MSLMDDAEVGYPETSMDLDARARFVARVYTHVFAAIVAFTLFEILLFTSGLAPVIARAMLGTTWLIVLGAFTLVGWLASRVAHQAISLPAQYLALAGFVGAEAIVFVPLLYIAQHYAPGVIQSAAAVTIMGFAGLTAIAFVTRKDFSFLGGLLRWAGVLALLLIVSSLLFGFQLGTFFSVAMVGLAGASILYDTSNVLHHYPEDRHVGASLELFSSVALMFWYVLRLFMSRR
jgi:FtsH-binding integral membrane protein